MSKPNEPTERDEMRPEYEFSGGLRGKYAKPYAEGTNVVCLEEDVAAVFPTAAAVNAALRALIGAARRTVPVSAKGGRPA